MRAACKGKATVAVLVALDDVRRSGLYREDRAYGCEESKLGTIRAARKFNVWVKQCMEAGQLVRCFPFAPCCNKAVLAHSSRPPPPPRTCSPLAASLPPTHTPL